VKIETFTPKEIICAEGYLPSYSIAGDIIFLLVVIGRISAVADRLTNKNEA